MHRLTRPFTALVTLLLAVAFLSGCKGEASSQVPTAAEDKVATGDEDTPKTNAEIRQWYNDQVATIDAENEQWLKDGLSAEERARKAYDIRHGARIEAREMMRNKAEVAALRARDQKKYGNPDGPTFDYLVEKNQDKGMEGDEVYEAIVGSSTRTDKDVNEKYGVDEASNE